MAEKKPKKHPGGRPPKYDPKMLPRIKKFLLLGLTNDQIADLLEINRSNFYKWIQRYKQLRDAILLTRAEADANVSVSLYKRATGYRHKAVKIIYDPNRAKPTYTAVPNEDGDTDFIPDPIDPLAGVIKVDYVEHYPPDTAAAKLWLENRQPGLFTRATKMEISGPEGGPLQTQVIDGLSFEQLMVLKYGPGYKAEGSTSEDTENEEAP